MSKYGFNFSYSNGTLEKGLQLSFSKNRLSFDIFFFYKHDNNYRYCGCYYGYKKFVKFLYHDFTTKEITFFNKRFNVPSNEEQFVIDDYGNEWNIPDPNFCWYTQPNNLYMYSCSILEMIDYLDLCDDSYTVKLVKYMMKRCEKVSHIIILDDESYDEKRRALIKYFNDNSITSEKYRIYKVREDKIDNFMSLIVFENDKDLGCYVNELDGKISGNDYDVIKYEMAVLNIEENYIIYE
jgi:hypothetical protein